MANIATQIASNNEIFELVEQSSFPVAIDEALQTCRRAHDMLLTMKNELEEVPVYASSPVNSYININLHVNDALQSSIRSIGHGANLVIRLRRMLSAEQRNEIAFDLHNMQREMVSTYAACQAADQELYQSLRHAVRQDPMLRDDPVAIQCVDAIEEHANQLQALPSTSESLHERSIMMDSMRSHLSALEERTGHVNPNGPLFKFLRIFRKGFVTITHMLHSVIKAVRYQFV